MDWCEYSAVSGSFKLGWSPLNTGDVGDHSRKVPSGEMVLSIKSNGEFRNTMGMSQSQIIIKIGCHTLPVLLDSGSSLNLMDMQYFKNNEGLSDLPVFPSPLNNIVDRKSVV